MLNTLTDITEYFRKIPVAFLIAIVTVLALILFLPEDFAKIVAVEDFRNKYRIYLGPALLLSFAFCVVRFYMFCMQSYFHRKQLERQIQTLHELTPEEKGYLISYIAKQQNSVYVGLDDGVMSGLRAKGITYQPSRTGTPLNGFAFNLQPWAREHLENNPQLLDGYAGQPLTPQQKLEIRYRM